MKYEELPENIQKQIDELRHYAQTIQSDVLDALESAENNEAPRYFCPQCQEEIEEADLTLVPEPAGLEKWRTMARHHPKDDVSKHPF